MDPRPAGARTPSIRALAVGLGLAFFVLYARRLCSALYLVGDSPELVTAAAVWGVPHGPGYPLFTLLSHGLTWLPFGTLPWRVHLGSAVFHAATVGAVVLATFTVTGSRIASLAAGIALGVSRSFFYASLYAEVFPLNDLLFACLLGLALELHRDGEGRRRRMLVALAILSGLASANHQTIALAAPALLVLTRRALGATLREDRAGALGLVAAFVAALGLAYALIPLAAARSPALSWGDVHDLRSLWSLATRQDYGGPFHAARHPSTAPGMVRVAAFASLVGGSMGGWTLAGAAGGLIDRLRRESVVGLALLLAIVFPGPAFAWINALGTDTPEILAIFERFTTMAQVPLAIAFGAGVSAARALVPPKRAWHLAIALALAAWSVSGARRVRGVGLSGDDLGTAFAHDLILRTPDHALILLAGDEQTNAALYVCAVEHRCGSRIVLAPGMLSLPWRMAQVRRAYPDLRIPWSDGPALPRIHEIVEAAAAERPVFVYPDLLVKDPALRAPPFTSLPDGLLFRVWNGPAAAASTFLASARALANGDCEGSPSLATMPARRTEQTIPVRAYEAAYRNHAAVAEELSRAGDAAAGELVSVLQTRADASRNRGPGAADEGR